jgi:hypothetical protein
MGVVAAAAAVVAGIVVAAAAVVIGTGAKQPNFHQPPLLPGAVVF